MNRHTGFDAVCARYWSFHCHEHPLDAAQAGCEMADDALLRDAPEDHERRADIARGLLNDLSAIDEATLTPNARVSRRLLARELGLLVRRVEVRAHLRPSLFPAGPDFLLAHWANTVTLQDDADARTYVRRLPLIRSALVGVQEALARGMDEGISFARRVVQVAASIARARAAQPPAQSAFFGPFLRAGERFGAERERALGEIQEQVSTALRAYADFLENTLATTARETVACIDDHLGQDHYDFLIEMHTTLAPDVARLHALGYEEVGRLALKMEHTATQAGHPGDLAAFRRQLLTDPTMIAPSANALREQIESLSKRIDARIPEFFGRTPRTTYGVRSIPPSLAAALPPAYAQANPADRSAAGVHWITSEPARLPAWLHIPIALHEAWPGHLMHLALIQEMAQLPEFRRHGAIRYTACIEGWALYCEGLGEDMGLYDTPAQQYGRLDMEMWRACRLVVDTGIHAYGWSRTQAIDFMASNLAISRATIDAEVDRYIAMPGQALAYQIGASVFRKQRQRAAAALGTRFKLRRCHDALLEAGPTTMPVLEEHMSAWIAAECAEPDARRSAQALQV